MSPVARMADANAMYPVGKAVELGALDIHRYIRKSGSRDPGKPGTSEFEYTILI